MHAVGRVFFIMMLSVVILHSSSGTARGLDKHKESAELPHKREAGDVPSSGSIGLQPFNSENYKDKHVDDMEDVLKRRKRDSEVLTPAPSQSDAKHAGVPVKEVDGKVHTQRDYAARKGGAGVPVKSDKDEKGHVTGVERDDHKGHDSKAHINKKHNALQGKSRPVDPIIELEEYGEENSHLPSFQTMEGLYKNAFHCAGSDDLPGLMAVFRSLTLAGASVKYVLEDLRTKDGDTLLIHSVKSNALDIVRYLLSIGADINAKNKRGDTPLSIAISKGDTEIINAITEIKVQYNIEEEEDGAAQS